MTRGARQLRRTGIACLTLAGLAACGGGSSMPPQPGQMRGSPPDLRGRRVVLLPVQHVRGVPGDADAELAYALRERGSEVEWITEDEVTDALARSPQLQTQTRGLPVTQFLVAEIRRIGDPLYGQLRRMSALVDAEAILLPVQLSYEPNQLVVNAQPRVRLTMALIEPRTGQVVWFGIEEGGDFPASDPRALASAVETVARTLLWYAGV